MKRLLTLLLLLCAVINLNAQTQLYGQIDIADLKLTTCDFEKGANALVLFDKTDVAATTDVTTITRHRRVKILNEQGLNQADITIEYYAKDHYEKVTELEAHTIYLDNGVIKTIPVDKSLIYNQINDKNTKTLKFSFPVVRPGSIIEYTYKRNVDFAGAVPDWDFQESVPVKYSEFNLKLATGYTYKIVPRVYVDYAKNIKEGIRSLGDSIGTHYLWAVKNVESFKDEPYTTRAEDNIQNIRFFLFQTPFADMKLQPRPHTWPLVVGMLLNDDDLWLDLNRKLKDDYNILPDAKLLHTDDEKIRLIFNRVKNNVKWDGKYRKYSYDDVKKAWEKKQGNSAEINLILFNFLRMAGVKCTPTYVSTRSNGKVEFALPGMEDFNTMVLTAATAANKNYVLDAGNKFNSYNSVPFALLNCYSLALHFDNKSYDLKVLKDEQPVKKGVFVNAQIKADGKLEGTAHLSSFGSIKTNNLQAYADLGETTYIERFRNGDNNLKILALQRENMESDSLPLIEHFDFKLDLTGSDERYIYVTPTLFTSFNKNPFLSEKRQADIDFGIQGSYSIKSLYKTPAGYKIDALPQGASMAMPDKSINFKRIVSEQDGQILIRFTIDFNRSIFTADEYPGIRNFYKKMFEMLNEQIVLKKI